MYRYEEVLTAEDMTKHNLEDLAVLKKLVAQSMSRRLRIKQVADHLGFAGSAQSMLGSALEQNGVGPDGRQHQGL